MTMRKIVQADRAEDFKTALRKRLDGPAMAQFALSETYKSILTDPSVVDKMAMIRESADEFGVFCKEKIDAGEPGFRGGLPEDFLNAIDAMTEKAIAKAETPWRGHRSDEQERERRAASARANLNHPYDPAPEDLEDKENKDMAEPKTKQEAFEAMKNIAKAARNPKETQEQAFARCLSADPQMQALNRVSKHLPSVTAALPMERYVPQDAGYQALLAKADELRKSDPKLTKEQAFAKVYMAPENLSLVAMHKRAAA